MTDRSERLKEARKAAGFPSAADAARHFDWPVPTYCAHENATRNFPYERAKDYAQAFGVGLQWLYDGDVDARHDFVPIVGTIGAGECVTPIDDHERGAAMEYAPMPPDMKEPNLVAVRIKGDSIADKDKAAEIKAGLQSQLIELQTEQIRLNAAEAGHPSLFVAGWRPAVGWLCVGALAWTYLVHPLLTWAAFAGGWETVPPTLDTEDLILLLGGMLGFGGFRSFEKVRGAARSSWSQTGLEQ